MDGAERFVGCMLGGAAGDALGYLIEYVDLKTIHKKYGPYGLRTVLKLEANGKRGIISDDTQLALFTADGLLWAKYDGLAPEDVVGIHTYCRDDCFEIIDARYLTRLPQTPQAAEAPASKA